MTQIALLDAAPLCACGCGEVVMSKWKSRYKLHHFAKSKENRMKLAKRMRGNTFSKGVIKKPEALLKKSIESSGEKNPAWKGGVINTGGYRLIYTPGHPHARKNHVNEERLVLEKHLNRYLKSNETVHHINGIKNDNRLENLQIMSLKEHQSYHAKQQWADGRFNIEILKGKRGPNVRTKFK